MQRFLGSATLVFLAATWCGLAEALEDQDAELGLPEVDSMLQDAFESVSAFNTQATTLQTLVQKKQEASRDAIALRKKEFEAELLKMEQNNSNTAAQNDEIRAGIKNLTEGNQKLVKEAEKLNRDSEILRNSLIVLEPKMTVARKFISDTLSKTNLTGLKELKVLEPPTPLPTIENFLSVANGTVDSSKSAAGQKAIDGTKSRRKGLLLLETSSGAKMSPQQQQQQQQAGSPTDEMVQTLSSRISELNSAQEQGAAQLEAHFIALSELQAKRYEALMAEQGELNQTRSRMVALQQELYTAQAHLNKTIEDLVQRIQGIRLFAKTMSNNAVTAMQEATKVHPANVSTGDAGLSKLSKQLSVLG